MHPKAIELFTAITDNKIEQVAAFVLAHPHAPWFLHEQDGILLCAFDHALNNDKKEIINIFLIKLYYEAYEGTRTPEAVLAFHYALVKVISETCSYFQSLDDFKEFFDKPEATLTFMTSSHKSWISLGKDILQVNPEIRHLIRAFALGFELKHFFNELNESSLETMLKALFIKITQLRNNPLFAEHRKFNFWVFSPLRGTTTSVELLDQMKEACEFLAKNQNTILNKIPSEASLDQATKIMLLCAKTYPFCEGAFKDYWLGLTEGLLDLEKFQQSPTAVHTLFKSLLNKDWLCTADNIPLVPSLLIQDLETRHIACYLRGYEQNTFADKLCKGPELRLHPGIGVGSELLAIYNSPKTRKCFVIDGPLDEDGKRYLHLLLMHSKTLFLSFAEESFAQNILQLFPYVETHVYVEISQIRALAHVNGQTEVNSHTFKKMGFAFTSELAAEVKSKKLEGFKEIHQYLGQLQIVDYQILIDENKGEILENSQQKKLSLTN